MTAILGHATRRYLLGVLSFVLLSPAVFSQSIELTSEQQQLLNSLPPAQRQQALSAITELQSQQSELPTTSINEQLDDPGFQDDSDLREELLL